MEADDWKDDVRDDGRMNDGDGFFNVFFSNMWI